MKRIYLSDADFLAPLPPKNLVRLGGKHDGGYIVDKDALASSKCLLSFGISYDLKFEYDFAALSGFTKKVFMYDKSTIPASLKIIWENILLSLKSQSIFPLLNYARFIFMWQSLIRHGSSLKRTNISNIEQLDCTTLSSILSQLPETTGIFLKINIEGDEYLILEDIMSSLASFNALVIEFHNVSAYWPRIKFFVRVIQENGLLVDHLHVNNYGGLSADGRPGVIEVSFSRVINRDSVVTELPRIGLDSPNSPLIEDFELFFTHETTD
jgi:hypothetical protein